MKKLSEQGFSIGGNSQNMWRFGVVWECLSMRHIGGGL